MKKALLVVVILACLASLLVLPSAAAEPTQELVGYLSNRGSDDYLWRPIGLDYQNPTPLGLLPNTAYIIEGVVFVTNVNGRIPNELEFTVFSNRVRVTWDYSQSSTMYRLWTESSQYLDELYRPSSTIGIYRYYGDVTEYERGYQAGYAAGYNEGLIVGRQNGDLEGYERGYAEAQAHWADEYRRGKQDGYREGLATAETGDWRSLIVSVVEVPFNTLQSLFSFEILGLDMRVAFGAILSLCAIVIVIKFCI